ncbi:unnamed protein product [Schistosoma margrebowiei]|uniref:Uncharacterized protein n=1 Tax=Schistosoma margrebowiei TaxID=48269 RepID=A0A183M6R7_9TREM|nr:unnamed protein product [Schistosoma margrebowiei]
MVVGGSRQETLDTGFVLLGTRQQGVPVILRELVTSLTVKLGDTGSSQSGSTSSLKITGTSC